MIGHKSFEICGRVIEMKPFKDSARIVNSFGQESPRVLTYRDKNDLKVIIDKKQEEAKHEKYLHKIVRNKAKTTYSKQSEAT